MVSYRMKGDSTVNRHTRLINCHFVSSYVAHVVELQIWNYKQFQFEQAFARQHTWRLQTSGRG